MFHLGPTALPGQVPEGTSAVEKALWGSEQHLLSLRALLFRIFPLVAVTTVIRTSCTS